MILSVRSFDGQQEHVLPWLRMAPALPRVAQIGGHGQALLAHGDRSCTVSDRVQSASFRTELMYDKGDEMKTEM
jgi:hypothetical protein